jgi:hypothetical protein
MPYEEYVTAREEQVRRRDEPEKEKKQILAAREREEREMELARRRERRRRETELARLEEEISAKESHYEKIEAELSDPVVFSDFSLAREKGEVLNSLRRELEGLYPRWEKLGRELEEQSPDNKKMD